MTARISTFALHQGPMMKLAVCVVDDEFELSRHFYLYPAGWSSNSDRMERVGPTVSEKLNGLLKAHPVLGCGGVLEYLGVVVDRQDPAFLQREIEEVFMLENGESMAKIAAAVTARLETLGII